MDESGFLLAYLPFWVVNFGLAMVGWTCLAIFILTPLTAGKPSPIVRRTLKDGKRVRVYKINGETVKENERERRS